MLNRIRKKLNVYWVSAFSAFFIAVVIACGGGGSGDGQITSIMIPDVECPNEVVVETTAGIFTFTLEDGCFEEGFIVDSPELLAQYESCFQLIDETFLFRVDTIPGESVSQAILTMFLPEVLPDNARLLACDFDTLELCEDITDLVEFVAKGPDMFEILITDNDGLDTDFALNGEATFVLALADAGCDLGETGGTSTGTGGSATGTGSGSGGDTTSTTSGTTTSSTTGGDTGGSGGSLLGVDADASVGDATVTGDATVGSDTTSGDSGGSFLGVDADATVGDSTVTGDATVADDTTTTDDGTSDDGGSLLGVDADATVGGTLLGADATVSGDDGGLLKGSGTSF